MDMDMDVDMDMDTDTDMARGAHSPRERCEGCAHLLDRRVGVDEVEVEAVLDDVERLDERALEMVVTFAREALVGVRRPHRLQRAHARELPVQA